VRACVCVGEWASGWVGGRAYKGYVNAVCVCAVCECECVCVYSHLLGRFLNMHS